METFSHFLSRKQRDTVERLGVIKGILEQAGFQVVSHLHARHDPHIYVAAPVDRHPVLESLSFKGVGVYARGDNIIAFRAQNGPDYHPFGEAYPLDIRQMFRDLVHDHMDKEKVGRKIMRHVAEELQQFFLQSAKAERDLEAPDPFTDKLDKSVVVPAATPLDMTALAKRLGA